MNYLFYFDSKNIFFKNKVENKENHSSIEDNDPEYDLTFNWFTKIPLKIKEKLYQFIINFVMQNYFQLT